ncbi:MULTISPECIES: oligosaccharyl transferase, archaeosortase A system-associated [Halorussus]|uniref:oligosaccharyl transferase, archaeosortase A system-associated n=1 Tax=Halorussus TaxID=1070314 RepID=UPI00209D0B3F|nr:oligosaccharyl transferase, archaeosortase A system-associated [Halorussus vallis]USZ76442.1 oligosaccharyl transferase, archaeosortase A system-associated [Halorussus vallis]
MSQQTEQVEDSTDTVGSVLDAFEDWYHVPVLGAAMVFMLWVRLQAFEKFTKGGEIFFSGNDAWYHFRQVTYTVHNWPKTMPYDPWTYFPFGTSVGQFGTLYDQLIATAALIVGLGDPSNQLIAKTLLVAPAVFGALVAVPTYFVGKRLAGRLGGLFGVVVLALLPGTFLRRGLVGFADHNIAEPLFMTFAVLAMMVALTVAERERPVYELLADRDFASLRRPLGYAVLAGVATALYLWTWPPGVLLIGIFGVFFMLKLSADYLRGVSPDHLAITGAVSMTVTGLLLLVPLGTLNPSPTKFSPLQPVLAFGVAAGCAFMAWLAREWDARDLDSRLYPAAIGGIIVAIAGVVALAAPKFFGLIRNNVIRVIGFETNAATRTIGEAQPFLSRAQPQYGIAWYDIIIQEYGLMLFTAIAAGLWMVWRAFRDDDHSAEKFLVLVWFAFLIAAAFTQVRFNYYLAVPVAVLNAYLVGQVFSWANLPSRDSLSDINGTQVVTVLLVVLLMTPVLVFPAQIGNSGNPFIDKTTTAVTTGQNTQPGAITKWDGSLDWLANSTPSEGDYANANNEAKMDYYGTYHQQDGDFSYPKGSYGVMSWWDYGHWITVEGERIPNANPFQEGADTAAKYLLAQNETRANNIIQRLGENQEDTRYVMVDWKMIEPTSKFSAPTVFNPNVSNWDFYTYVYSGLQQNQPRVSFLMKDQSYYQSQMVRLYLYHGSAVEPRPYVVDYDRISGANASKFVQEDQGANSTVVRKFPTMKQARQFVQQDGSAQIGGIGPFPNERIPALNHYRIVKQSKASGTSSQSYLRTLQGEARLLQQAGINPREMFMTSPSWVKTFERVPGATVQGTGPKNTTVTAQVRMSPVGQNGTFTYRQQAKTGADGKFTMTLPYSTTGYDNWGPKQGYTNVSVQAVGPYQFTTQGNWQNGTLHYQNATAQVTEAQVIGESQKPVNVKLTPTTYTPPNQNQSQNNSSAPPANESAPGAGNSTAPSADNSTAAGNGTAPTGNGSAATNNSSALGAPSAESAKAKPTPADALPDREETTPLRAGLVGAFGAAAVVASRD